VSPSGAARRARQARSTVLTSTFFGIQPVPRQVPAKPSCSTRAVRAPSPNPVRAAQLPAVPAPMTKSS